MASIVVVEDGEAVRLALSKMLRSAGHDVKAYEDARPVVDEVDFRGVDLVITDLQMPMPGDELLKVLEERGIAVPVVVLTGSRVSGLAERLKALGAARVLEKPFSMSELLGTVAELTGST